MNQNYKKKIIKQVLCFKNIDFVNKMPVLLKTFLYL